MMRLRSRFCWGGRWTRRWRGLAIEHLGASSPRSVTFAPSVRNILTIAQRMGDADAALAQMEAQGIARTQIMRALQER